MAFTSIKDPYDGYCGTSYAARVLGISVGTVHSLVKSNELRAWKTQGGHRRISLQSIQEYQRRNNLAAGSVLPGANRLRVMVVEDDTSTRLMLQANMRKWDIPIDAVMYASAVEALLDMPGWQPEVLLTDLRMSHVDGFEFLKILSEHAMFSGLTIVAITGMSARDVQAKGGLPDGVQLLQKPIDLEWLRGFFDALMSMRQHNRKTRT